jgi:hypothetical protein
MTESTMPWPPPVGSKWTSKYTGNQITVLEAKPWCFGTIVIRLLYLHPLGRGEIHRGYSQRNWYHIYEVRDDEDV